MNGIDDDREVARYSISEVAERTGLSAHTLRWYERIGLMPHVARQGAAGAGGKGARRRYSDRDLDWLAFVGKLRLTGMPVADMIRYAELVKAGDDTFGERQELLEAHRATVRDRITDLQACLLVLDYKIDTYADARRASEKEWAHDAHDDPRQHDGIRARGA